MLNGDTTPSGGASMPSPFGGGGSPFNPFMPSNDSKPSGGGFNVDDLVKRIDAKIAELEEEERQEKIKLEEENKIKLESTKEVSEITKAEVPIEEPKAKNGITDDQFFDDFFFDE